MIQRVFIAILFLTPWQSSLAEVYTLHNSARALGMGNAYISVVRDSDAFYFNPAAFGTTDRYFWTIADPVVGLNGTEALTNLQQFSSSSDFASALAGLAGQRYWANGTGKMSVQIANFAFAVYNGFDASMAIDDPSNPSMNLNFVNDVNYAFGFGFNVVKSLYMGFNVRWVTRTGNRTTFDSTQLLTLDQATFDAAIANKGTAIAGDFGMSFALDTIIDPTFSIVVRNIGDTSFNEAGSSQKPPSEPQEVIVGASIASDFPLFSVTPSVDIRFADDPDVDFNEKLHIGVELGLPLVDVRAGLNQTYWTAGVGIGFGPLQFDVAAFGQEIGTSSNKQEERRYVAQVTIELGFDAGSSSGGRNSKGGDLKSRRRRSNLKQRR